MAHFAKLDIDNTVIEVITINNDVLDPTNEEGSGIAFCQSIYGQNTRWIQTSYNNSFRKRFAAIGYRYDFVRDAFIAPKPFNSWILNEETCQWNPPTPYPNDGKSYIWVEDDLNWQPIESEV
jgi:hypothetical protein